MDITCICKAILCIGILQTCSLYHVCAVDGNLFQVPEMVEWAEAERTCQKNNGKLFQPNERSFDVSLFSECNVNDDLWVAATYINILNVGSAFRGDSFIRCEMCKTDASCGVICLYKACGNQCSILCKGLYDSHNPLVSYTQHNWTEAKIWCSGYASELDEKIQTASFLSRYCFPGCFWTRNVVLVQLQTEIAQGNDPEECGILHNGTISFTSCNRYLHPLCERVAMPTLETRRYYFSEGNNSCTLMNTKITPMKTTQRISRIHATITTSSKYGTLSVANEIEKRTTIGLNEENSSLLVQVAATTSKTDLESAPPSKNDLEDSLKESDTGIIIGAVVGSVVFLMLTVLGIICVRRKLLQSTFRSKHESKTVSQYQRHDVPLESESGLTPFAQLESKCEGSSSDIGGPKPNPGNSDFMIDPEGSNFSYAIVAKKVNLNASNLTSKINDDSYDHLSDIRQSRYDNVAGNVYDTTNFEQRNDSTYDISGGHSKAPDEGVGLYDRVNTTISSEYDTTDDLRRDSNAVYDHI